MKLTGLKTMFSVNCGASMPAVSDLTPRQGIQGLRIIPLDWPTASALHINNANHPSLQQDKVKTKDALQDTHDVFIWSVQSLLRVSNSWNYRDNKCIKSHPRNDSCFYVWADHNKLVTLPADGRQGHYMTTLLDCCRWHADVFQDRASTGYIHRSILANVA